MHALTKDQATINSKTYCIVQAQLMPGLEKFVLLVKKFYIYWSKTFSLFFIFFTKIVSQFFISLARIKFFTVFFFIIFLKTIHTSSVWCEFSNNRSKVISDCQMSFQRLATSFKTPMLITYNSHTLSERNETLWKCLVFEGSKPNNVLSNLKKNS